MAVVLTEEGRIDEVGDGLGDGVGAMACENEEDIRITLIELEDGNGVGAMECEIEEVKGEQ